MDSEEVATYWRKKHLKYFITDAIGFVGGTLTKQLRAAMTGVFHVAG